MLRFEFQEGLIAIHRLPLVGLRLTKAELLQLLLWVILIILSLWAGFIIISLHLIDLFLTLFADLNLVNGLRQAGRDTETELSNFFKLTHSITHQKGLSTLQVLLMTARGAITAESVTLALH